MNELQTKQKCFEEEKTVPPTTIPPATVEVIKMTRSLSLGYEDNLVKDKKLKFNEGLAQLRPLFVKPYLRLSIQVYLLNFCILMG